MSLTVALNLILAASISFAVVGALVWAIRTARPDDGLPGKPRASGAGRPCHTDRASGRPPDHSLPPLPGTRAPQAQHHELGHAVREETVLVPPG